jgi:hypothetical protein
MRSAIIGTLAFAILIAGTTAMVPFSGAQTSPLVIQPGSGTFPVDSTQQFRALYNGQDVTSQATWAISGAYSNDPRRGEVLAPGQVRLIYGGSDVYVQARYQGAFASAQLNVTGQIIGQTFRLVANDHNLRQGETVSVKAEYAPGRTCTGSGQCLPQYGDVTSQTNWTVSNPSAVQMVSPGTFRALTDNPTATITATYSGLTQTVVLLPTTENANLGNGVTLVKEIYNRADIPFLWYSQTTPFHNAEYLSGGYFVVAGTCSPKVSGNETVSSEGASNNIGLQGGLYAFKDDGTFIGKRNVCYDGDIPGSGAPLAGLYCNEGAACEIPMNLSPLGPNQVLREMNRQFYNTTHGFNSRPPLQYQITPTGINLAGKPYSGSRNWDWPEGSGDRIQIGNNVVVSGKIFSIKAKYDAAAAGRFVCPNVSSLSGGQPATLPELVPIAGVGDYLIAHKTQGSTGGFMSSETRTVRVYRLKADNTLEEVQQLPGLQQDRI